MMTTYLTFAAFVHFAAYAHLYVTGSKVASLRASATAYRSINDTSVFSAWYTQDNSPLRILELNPGLDKVEILTPSIYRGYLSPIKFPGVSIFQVVDFDVSFDGVDLFMKVEKDVIKQEYRGKKWLVNIFSKLPSAAVRSTARLTLKEAQRQLCYRADLEVFMYLPSWFPLSADSFESSGSKTVEKKLMKDIDVFMNNLMRNYGDWTREEAREMKSHPFRKRLELIRRRASHLVHRMKYSFETTHNNMIQHQQWRDDIQSKWRVSMGRLKSLITVPGNNARYN